MEPFAAIPHDDLLKLILSVAVLLGTARLLGQGMRRIGQPAIVGELLAGVILGPALLSGAFPVFGRWIVPQSELQSHLLGVVGMFGLMLLILVVGMETDLALIRTHARSALSIGLMGFIIPFGFGLVGSQLFPDHLLGEPGSRPVFALFLAVALALSAIPVLAKILSDLNVLRGRFGQVALAAGMFDDIVGWTALGLVTALATVGRITVGGVVGTVGSLSVFIAVSYWVGRPLARWGLSLVQDKTRMRDGVLSFAIVFAFGFGAFSQALHLEPVLGAFAAGIILGRHRRFPAQVVRQLESMTMGIFAPIFLAIVGLRLDLDIFVNAELRWLTVALIAIASLGKLVGAFLGARVLSDFDNRHALAFGAALNARGVLGIIVAVIGQSLGLFGPEVYAMIVVTSIVTSIAAPVALKSILGAEVDATSREPPDHGPYNSVLVPVRATPNIDIKLRQIESAVIDRVVAKPPEITLMTVVENKGQKEGSAFLEGLTRTFPREAQIHRRVRTGDPAAEILNEAAAGHDLILLGASAARLDPDSLFEPIVDSVVRLAPCDTMVFASGDGAWPPRRILAPTGGGVAAKRAAELAFAISGVDARVVLLHVVDPELVLIPNTRRRSLARSMEIGQGLLADLREVGERSDVVVTSEMVTGTRIVTAILERARQEIDLIVLGTQVRIGSSRLYLGPKVERLLQEAPCSTIVLNSSTQQSLP